MTAILKITAGKQLLFVCKWSLVSKNIIQNFNEVGQKIRSWEKTF